MPSRCCLPTGELLDASLPIPRVLAGRVPRLPRYYQGTATSCRPSRRASFPSLGGTTGPRIVRSRRRCVWQRRAWGCSPGIPVRECFRGDDRISQVPGEPRFPFAHVLRPRPAPACLTTCGTLGVAPANRTTRASTVRTISGLNSMAFELAVYASQGRLPFLTQDSLPAAGQALLDGLLPARSQYKVSNHSTFLLIQASWRNLSSSCLHPISVLSSSYLCLVFVLSSNDPKFPAKTRGNRERRNWQRNSAGRRQALLLDRDRAPTLLDNRYFKNYRYSGEVLKNTNPLELV